MSAQGYRNIVDVGGRLSSKVSGDCREKGRGVKQHIQINVEAILLPKLLHNSAVCDAVILYGEQ